MSKEAWLSSFFDEALILFLCAISVFSVSLW
jgi:hypothetical protein